MEYEIIKVDNPNVIRLKIIHSKKFVDLIIENGTLENIKQDENIHKILSEYKKKKYRVFTSISGKEDMKKILENLIIAEFDRLVELKARE